MNDMFHRIKLALLFRVLRRLRKLEMNDVIHFIVMDYSNKFPDDEIIFLSLPKKDPQIRQQTLDFFIKHVCSSEYGNKV